MVLTKMEKAHKQNTVHHYHQEEKKALPQEPSSLLLMYSLLLKHLLIRQNLLLYEYEKMSGSIDAKKTSHLRSGEHKISKVQITIENFPSFSQVISYSLPQYFDLKSALAASKS